LIPAPATYLEQLRRFIDATDDRDIDIAAATSFYRKHLRSAGSGSGSGVRKFRYMPGASCFDHVR
jgi:hypothetical protein